MPAGLQVLNSDNVVQIDENYRNLSLVASGQYVANNAVSQNDSWFRDLIDVWSRLSVSAVMAVVTSSGIGLNLGIGTFRNGVKVMQYLYRINTDTPFQYYIFDLVAPTASSRFGMQVFNPRGELVFDALDYPLKILASFTIPIGPVDVDRAIYAGPHGNIAWCALGGGFVASATTFDLEENHMYTRIIGHVLYARNTYDPYGGNYNGPDGTYGILEQSGMIVDTTGLPPNYRRWA